MSLDYSVNRNYLPAHPAPSERGRCASSRNVGAGCDGAQACVGMFACRTKRGRRPAKSRGPGAATLASIRAAPWRRGNGGNKGRSPGRSRSKPSNHCAGKAGMFGLYLSNPCAPFIALFAHGDAGAVGARLSLRPFDERGPTTTHHPGGIAPRERESAPPSSSCTATKNLHTRLPSGRLWSSQPHVFPDRVFPGPAFRDRSSQ
jgi:hypothetical protein